MGLFDFLKPAVESKNPEKRLLAVHKINDQEELYKIATKSLYNDVCIAAIQKITEQRLLSSIIIEDKSTHDGREAAFEKLTDQQTLMTLITDYKGFLPDEIIPKLTDESITALIKTKDFSDKSELINCLIERKNNLAIELALKNFKEPSGGGYLTDLNFFEMVQNYNPETLRPFFRDFLEKVFAHTPKNLIWFADDKVKSRNGLDDYLWHQADQTDSKLKHLSNDSDVYSHWYWYAHTDFLENFFRSAAAVGTDLKPIIRAICEKNHETLLLLFLYALHGIINYDGYDLPLNKEQKDTVRSWIPDKTDEPILSLRNLNYLSKIVDDYTFCKPLTFFYPTFNDYRFCSMLDHFSRYNFESFIEIVELELVNGHSKKISDTALEANTPLKYFVFISRSLAYFKTDAKKMANSIFAEQINTLDSLAIDEKEIVNRYIDKHLHDKNESIVGTLKEIYSLKELEQFGFTYTTYEIEGEDQYGRYTNTHYSFFYKGQELHKN